MVSLSGVTVNMCCDARRVTSAVKIFASVQITAKQRFNHIRGDFENEGVTGIGLDKLPPDGVIRKISELENAILAVDAIIEESSPPKRR